MCRSIVESDPNALADTPNNLNVNLTKLYSYFELMLILYDYPPRKQIPDMGYKLLVSGISHSSMYKKMHMN